MRSRFVFLSLTLFSLTTFAKESAVERPCSTIEIHTEEKLKLSKTERKWICGDDESSSWRKVPPWQAQFFLKTFLQDRGYHKPSFEVRGEHLIVAVGEKTILKTFRFINPPEGFHPEKRRKLKGRPLTPTLLSEIEGWTKARLQNRGYACPKVEVTSVANEGSMQIFIEPGQKHYFPDTDLFDVRGSKRQVYLDRYEAFLPDQLFDLRLTQLTANRMVYDEFHLSSYFDVTCNENEELQLTPRLVTGDPQLISAGVGANTEVGALARLRYKHTQMDNSGSYFESQLFLSFVEQSFENSFKLYDGPPYRDRDYWMPRLFLRNEIEGKYEAFSASLALLYGSTIESESFRTEFRLGPAYTHTSIREPATNTFASFSTQGDISFQSHDYEYFLRDPREGWQVSTTIESAYENLGANQTFHQWTYQHQLLSNWNDWDPPLLILGWRFKAGTFLMDNDRLFFTVVPENLRFYLGGDGNLRGFSRKQIPINRPGSMTYLYQGFEVRAGDVFPYNLQPFVFFDMAWEGDRSLELERTLYYSPGVGVRWSSFIGPIRASLSRGSALYEDEVEVKSHWQFYLSLGREF